MLAYNAALNNIQHSSILCLPKPLSPTPATFQLSSGWSFCYVMWHSGGANELVITAIFPPIECEATEARGCIWILPGVVTAAIAFARDCMCRGRVTEVERDINDAPKAFLSSLDCSFRKNAVKKRTGTMSQETAYILYVLNALVFKEEKVLHPLQVSRFVLRHPTSLPFSHVLWIILLKNEDVRRTSNTFCCQWCYCTIDTWSLNLTMQFHIL